MIPFTPEENDKYNDWDSGTTAYLAAEWLSEIKHDYEPICMGCVMGQEFNMKESPFTPSNKEGCCVCFLSMNKLFIDLYANVNTASLCCCKIYGSESIVNRMRAIARGDLWKR